MKRQEIEYEIFNIANGYFGEEKKVTLHGSFARDSQIDSLQKVELIILIEKKFKISIHDDAALQLDSLSDVCSLIEKRLEVRN